MTGTGGDIYNLASQTQVLRILECPICTDIPLPPIFGCENGHMICSKCRSQLDKCGLCKAVFSKARNFPLEEIVNSSTFRCKFEEDGCDQRVRGDAYKQHLEKCEFRPFVCNHTTNKKCENQSIHLRNLVKHLSEDHKLLKKTMPEDGLMHKEITSFSFNNATWPLICIEFNNKWFFRRQTIENGVLCVWLTYFGEDSEATKYQVEITISREDEKLPSVKWKIPIHSFRKLPKEVKESGVYAAVPVSQLKKMSELDTTGRFVWNAKYSIRNL